MQLSRVCSVFAQAMPVLLTYSEGLELGFNFQYEESGNMKHFCLDSGLPLQWAACLTALYVRQSSLKVPGLEAFLTKAVKLEYMEVETHDALAAARADHLLSKCAPTLKDMRICGVMLPSVIPKTLSCLSAQLLDPEHGFHMSGWNDTRIEALLFKLSKLPALQTVCLDFDTEHISLDSNDNLRRLEHLSITLRIRKVLSVGLSWVQVQSCSDLSVRIIINDSELVRNRLVQAELEEMKLLRLSLDVCAEWDWGLQRMWSRLSTQILDISVEVPLCVGTSAAPLQFLPSFEEAIVYLAKCKPAQVDFHVCWALLTHKPASIVIMAADLKLLVHGADLSDIEHMQQPWQLLVCGASSIVGLPASTSSNASDSPARWQSWQNAAARAAGWTGDPSLDWTDL